MQQNRKQQLLTAITAAGLWLVSNSGLANTVTAVNQADVAQFIDDTVKEYGLDKRFVTETLAQARSNQAVLDAIQRPWEAKPWHQYYPIFLTQKRINKGVSFWQTHRKTLERAEKELGVPAHIIVAIIGVETYYGAYKGKYKVLDALYSLGFQYPPRSAFFRKELAQYLQLVHEEQWQADAQKGSYAGAMGWGQFISSSYRHYAIDFDGDGKRDLLSNPVDAIGSVANYFKAHHWQPGEPVAYQVTADDDRVQHLVNDELKIQHSWKVLQDNGVTLQTPTDIPGEQAAKLLALQQAENQEYWAVFDNFYVITRYNHSPLYAMAVYQLSLAIKQEMQP